MPVHDWTRVEAGLFHSLHVTWIAELNRALNAGLLPPGYYALAEQHAGRTIADVLTLHASPACQEPLPLPPATGGSAVAEAPPRVRRKHTVEPAAVARRRTLAIRHVSGHRLVADDGTRAAARVELGYVESGERRQTASALPDLPTNFPDGWPYRAVEQIIDVRSD